jgi:hypothetical protein
MDLLDISKEAFNLFWNDTSMSDLRKQDIHSINSTIDDRQETIFENVLESHKGSTFDIKI